MKTQNKIFQAHLIVLMALFVSSIVLDQVSKIHAENDLMTYSDPENVKIYQGRQIPLWQIGEREGESGYFGFGLQYVRNQGAAWGALQGLDASIREPFFYSVTLLAVIMIIYFFRTTPASHRLARLALILVMSGAIGNFLDRIRLTYVIDWIDVRWRLFGWYYDFPKFNIADSCITVGVSFLLIDMLFLERIRHAKQKTNESSVIEEKVSA